MVWSSFLYFPLDYPKCPVLLNSLCLCAWIHSSASHLEQASLVSVVLLALSSLYVHLVPLTGPNHLVEVVDQSRVQRVSVYQAHQVLPVVLTVGTNTPESQTLPSSKEVQIHLQYLIFIFRRCVGNFTQLQPEQSQYWLCVGSRPTWGNYPTTTLLTSCRSAESAWAGSAESPFSLETAATNVAVTVNLNSKLQTGVSSCLTWFTLWITLWVLKGKSWC